MPKASRDKGARGERELARVLTELTEVEWRRGVSQSRFGGREGADVECVELEAWNDWHLEVKRRKDYVDLHAAMAQACRDAQERDRSPVVVWRVDRRPWRVTVRAGDLVLDCMTYGSCRGHLKAKGSTPPTWRLYEGELGELVTLDLDVWCRLVQYWWRSSK